LRGKTSTLWARTGAHIWGRTGARIVQWLRGHCSGYVRNLDDDFVEAFLERFSPTAAKIGAQFRVKRALYRRKHGPFFLVGEDANAIYDYVAIALARSSSSGYSAPTDTTHQFSIVNKFAKMHHASRIIRRPNEGLHHPSPKNAGHASCIMRQNQACIIHHQNPLM
jgi:hypothetical protein